MQEFELKILGSSSATPSATRFPTAQVLSIGNQSILIDCGEGTQMQLMRFKLRAQRIGHIFISHLHGDHYFGLLGLISTMQLQGRTAPLHLFGPPGLSEIISLSLKYSSTFLAYPIHFQELDQSCYSLIFENAQYTVHTLPMEHRIPCCGFLFREKQKSRHLVKEKLPPGLTPADYLRLKNGEDLYDEAGNVVVRNSQVTSAPNHSRSYAYCADSRYKEDLLPYLHQVDLLYHEATFLDEMRPRAFQTFHSTALQAGILAQKAEVGQLLIGHFSTRYKDLTPLLNEAQTVFAKTALALEGTTVQVPE